MAQRNVNVFSIDRSRGNRAFVSWCRDWILSRGQVVIKQIAENPRHKNQIQAIQLIFAYGYGRPQVFDPEPPDQLQGLENRPHEAKAYLGQLIEGETIDSVAIREDSRDSPPTNPPSIPNP